MYSVSPSLSEHYIKPERCYLTHAEAQLVDLYKSQMHFLINISESPYYNRIQFINHIEHFIVCLEHRLENNTKYSDPYGILTGKTPVITPTLRRALMRLKIRLSESITLLNENEDYHDIFRLQLEMALEDSELEDFECEAVMAKKMQELQDDFVKALHEEHALIVEHMAKKL